MECIKKCGCKGIRTCLLCEKEGKLSKSGDEKEDTVQYEYCPHCNLCWPLGKHAGEAPLYLGKLTLVPDFLTEEEENEIVASIDSMQWMPSQSGRMKQDFGPKVNFKKKKGKIGDFKGFPRFTENLIKRLGHFGDLSDFHPVELCHLDYDPDRGSAIEPHRDDTWIWGERLVTLNLVSPTILTLTPANAEETCDCQTQCLDMTTRSSDDIEHYNCNFPLDCLNTSVDSSNENKQCNCNITLNCCTRDCSPEVPNSNPVDDECNTNGIVQSHLKGTACCQTECLRTCALNTGSINKMKYSNHNCPVHCAFKEDSLNPKDFISDGDMEQLQTVHAHQTQCFRTSNESKPCNHKKLLNNTHERSPNGQESCVVEAMCTAYRVGEHERPKVEVLIPLPARSLVVIAGCSRHNWFHEIRRKDIASRRLAMTFRELSPNFMSGGSDEILGKELLELGRTFWEMNV